MSAISPPIEYQRGDTLSIPDFPGNTIGDRLEALRRWLKASQASFGQAFNRSQATVSQYETGALEPEEEWLAYVSASIFRDAQAGLRWFLEGGALPETRVRKWRDLAAESLKWQVAERTAPYLDTERTPKPIGATVMESEVALHVGEAVARAIQRTIDKNELWYEGEGRKDLIESLTVLAGEFARRHIESEDILEAIAYLRSRER